AAANALRDGPPYNVEYRVVRPNGEVRFIHSEAVVNRDESGRPRSMLGMMQDITERKRVEEALRQSEWRYREIFDNVLDSLFLVEVTEDGHFRNLEMNPAFETTTIVNAKYRHCVETGQPIEEEVELDLPTGRRYFQSTLIPARDETGKIHRLIGISRDITEHKKAQMQILASEQLFRALVENSPDFIARYDREFRRVYVNPAIQKLFGKSVENVLNQTPADESPVYAPQIYIDQLRQVIETGAERAVEMPFRTVQGEMHWAHMRFVPEFGPDGQVASVLAIGRDIHEIKENEQRFRRLAENFPDFVMRFDRDDRLTYVNPAVEKAFGLPAEAFIGKTLPELPQNHRLEQNETLMALIRRAFEEGFANNSEVFWETQLGQRIFEIRHVPEKDATGNVVSVLSIAHDITERKRAEQERLAHLRFFECMDQINRAIQGTNDLEQMMSDVLDVALSIFECDRAWLIYPCDPEAASWGMPIERTRPEYPGASALGVPIPVTPDTVQFFQTVRDASGPAQFGLGAAHPLPVQNRELYRIQSILAMSIYPKVDKPYMFGLHQCSHPRIWTPEEERLFQEIGRRLADALTGLLVYRDLQESEARFRTLVNHAADAFYLHDAQGTILDVNCQACESLGYSREELIGMTPYDFDAGFDPSFIDQMEARLDAGEVIAVDTRHRRKDGSMFPVEVRVRPFWQGQRRFSVSLARDITERKRAEEEIHRLNQELEQRVLWKPLPTPSPTTCAPPCAILTASWNCSNREWRGRSTSAASTI
ncbi:MAG: hypothetical protein DPW09_45265, partial [Anaerolineae bacterium]|nr:hypothetical protein [Anaerolineae bacterium]